MPPQRTDESPRTVTLESNTTEIPYYAGDMAIALGSLDSSNPIVSVTANGAPVANQGEFVIEPLSPGMTIEVSTVAQMYNVTFSFNDDHARTYITRVAIGDDAVENYNNPDGFEVAQNKNVTVYLDASITDVKIDVNGIEQEPTVLPIPGVDPFVTFEVTGPCTVNVRTVTTEDPVDNTFTVNVDDKDRVWVGYMKPASMSFLPPTPVTFELASGDNTVEIPDGCTEIFVRPATESCKIVKVTKDDEELPSENYENIPVIPGTKLAVTSSLASGIFEIVEKEAQGVVYYDSKGTRVSEPVKGALYIKVENGKVEKVIF